ncbi:hypothetical protein [Leptospira sp. GIMC2001]|uniref:hypothetical protein n=1 Tax=Leptospira sp. GIMC2001 TaxID=1513297 RepID=UPI00234BDE52|nr:hypothetical protein [Leptospira sp. GIMC2001]WCL49199.1 hypothetical protein O4O04_18185 [Leptospira sp. GIMC2001]
MRRLLMTVLMVMFPLGLLLADTFEVSNKLIAWNKLSWDDFLAELKKKKIALRCEQKSKWMDFFEKEKAKANSIEEVITKTDSEIDQMVYIGDEFT